MTMIYLQPTNRRKSKRVRNSLLIGALLALLFLAHTFFPHFLTPAVRTIGMPIINSRLVAASGLMTVWNSFRTKNGIARENIALKERIALLDAVTVERDVLKKENQELQNLLGRIGTTTDHSNIVMARILSKPGYSAYDTVILDRGTQGGVQKGDKILADNAIIIGELSEVYDTTSTAVLYSSAGIKSEVLIGPQALQVIAIGKGGGTLEIKLPQNAGVVVGDAAVLAQNPEKIFGTIETITTNPTDSFESVLLKSPVDISELKYVIIVKK